MFKKILLLILFLLMIFNKVILSNIIIFSLENRTNKDIDLEKIKISYKNTLLTFENIKVRDVHKHNERILFTAEKIIIDFDLKSFFSTLIIIDELEIIKANLSLYFEFSKDDKITNDSMKILKNIQNKNPKIYPKKNVDINFLIKNFEIKNSTAVIKKNNDKKNIKIKLSDMHFKLFGNEKGYQHYKDIFKIILTDITLKIPDKLFRKKILETYSIN